MAWWDHEELKSKKDRSDRYILAFPGEYSVEEVRNARDRETNRKADDLRLAKDAGIMGTMQQRVDEDTAWAERMARADAEVFEMRLCETKNVVLKPDTLYRFTVDPTCRRCLEIALRSLPDAG